MACWPHTASANAAILNLEPDPTHESSYRDLNSRYSERPDWPSKGGRHFRRSKIRGNSNPTVCRNLANGTSARKRLNSMAAA